MRCKNKMQKFQILSKSETFYNGRDIQCFFPFTFILFQYFLLPGVPKNIK